MELEQEKISGFFAEKFPLIGVVSGLLLMLSGLGLSLTHGDHWAHEFLSSYLFSFVFFLSICVGGMFFTIIQFLTKAGWSVVIRRIWELMMSNVLVMAVLLIPILLGIDSIYHHWVHGAHDPIISKKLWYLNKPFFVIRMIAYFAVWFLISRFFFKNSTNQDESKDIGLTSKMEKYATVATMGFGVTVTFAAFDLMMTLEPHWYSTIFGVYYFAGSAMTGMALVGLIIVILQSRGLMKVVNVEHFHDIGKLLFGFCVFWAYIAFSQFFLIWYGNIPEETMWYMDRQNGNWLNYSIFLIIGHVALPILFLLSRHVKRNIKAAAVMYVWMIFMQAVDLYWIVKPTMQKESAHPEFHLTMIDLTVFIGMGLLFFGFLVRTMSKHSLIPVGDPRLKESVHFHNV